MKKTTKSGVKQALNIFMPADFHEELKEFIQVHGTPKESMNIFFCEAAQQELQLRQAEAGLSVVSDEELAKKIARLEEIRAKQTA